MASVELKGLSKHYGNAVAVDGVSLRVEHGQLVCLLGPSGCGKTTTLRLIAGFIEPSAGEIVVGGKVLSSPARTVPPEGRNMSMIFQSYALWPHMTVAENVAYGLKIRKLDKAIIEAKLKAILSTARLEALRDRYPGELSGGQQQRVSLARALVVEPETLLLDEPLSNLDANLREEMRFEIRRLHDQYRYTTIYVTHDQAEAMTTADLIAVMNHGKVEQLGPPEEIYGRPRSEFVARFIGGANILRGAGTGRRARVGRRLGLAHHGPDAQGRQARGAVGAPARDRPCRREAAIRRRQSPSRRGDAAGLSRLGARLYRRARRQDGTARDGAARPQHRAGRIGVALSAGGTMPGIGGGMTR